MKNVLVFVPKRFLANKSGFIEGFRTNHGNIETYYITNPLIVSRCNNPVGYTGQFLVKEHLSKKFIFIQCGSKNIQINNVEEDKDLCITTVLYDYEAFQTSNVVCDGNGNYGVHIKELTEKLVRDKQEDHTNGNKAAVFYWMIILINLMINLLHKFNSAIKNCAILTSIESSLRTLKWFLHSLQQEKAFSPKTGSLLVAKFLDLILGLGFIYLCLKFERPIILKSGHISQDFVTRLRELLIYLMGSPIGLKLNYAFNHSLGKFFFYHINLWRVFLQTMQPLLEANFKLLLLPGLFGFSYQIAMFCDIISLATFHVYCIYVYAARLFFLQIKGLGSLWRLFIGRKSNPLRNRVDSCEYSSNQLFIGTLGFTILLFLLPTTTMYYTVFAAFRLATLFTYKLFTKIRDVISNIPLYTLILWTFKSPSIAGTLNVYWIESTTIEVKLGPLSLKDSVEQFSSPTKEVCSETKPCLGTIVSSLFTGKLV